MKPADLLVEIGTEELPPEALRGLMDAFADHLGAAIDDAWLAHGPVHAYASPRRLAVLVENLARVQQDREVQLKGPPVSVALDEGGKPTAAGLKFALKCAVDFPAIGRIKTDKGEWLAYSSIEKGRAAADLLPALIERALAALPMPRRMRWGAGSAEFVRPVRWIVLLHGKDIVAGEVMGIATGRHSQGHRFLTSGPVVIRQPADYLGSLEKKGHVIADFERRRELVLAGVEAAAREAGGVVVDGESLYDEVASLVEWPVPMLGRFDEAFLQLPREVVISTLTRHQRYFPVAGKTGDLLPMFIAVANLESLEPEKVRAGNERVIGARLADAAFFWDGDRRKSLAGRVEALREVVYQQGLGSLYDKCERIGSIVTWIAAQHGADATNARRAAMLCKCDLLTGLVGEFPDLQGVMGRYYAGLDGEPPPVAEAIGEHYRPRHAGDDLPATPDGRMLALADKVDSLAGIFVIGKKPSGNRDPFGLRRAALAIIRIIIECDLDVDLEALLANAVAAQPPGKSDARELCDGLYTFITERLRRYLLDRDDGLATETFDAVLIRRPSSLVDFDRRLQAVQAFLDLDEAASLTAANKRIANMLRQAGKAGQADGIDVRKKLLLEPAEVALHEALGKAGRTVRPLLKARRYTDVLRTLAGLKDPVDKFFDDVLVMADDEDIRKNRLALLGKLRALFLDVADISRLSAL